MRGRIRVRRFAAIAPLCNLWVQEYFKVAVRGGTFGLHSFMLSLSQWLLTLAFAPAKTSAPSDFLAGSVATLVLALWPRHLFATQVASS